MQIEPGYTIPLVYQLADPSDSATYYVRAVVRGSFSGSTITSVNLTQGSNGRFTGSFLSPKDPTGQGFFIDVTIQVYTDSGYSVLAPGYQRETNIYLVRKAQQSWGGGGSVDVDYDKIEKLLKKHKADAYDDSLILESVNKLIEIMKAVEFPEMPEMPEPKEVDLTPVLSHIDKHTKAITSHVSKEVKGIEFPEQKEVNTQPIIDLLNEVLDGHTKFADISNAHKEELKKHLEGVRADLASDDQARAQSASEAVRKIFEALGQHLPEGGFVATPRDKGAKEGAKPSPFMEFINKPNMP